MRITKAKFDGAKVRIEYEQERPDKQYDEFSLQSSDRPTAAFLSALNALAEDVRGVDGGTSGLAREVSEPANTREQALIASLERLIQQWRSEAAEEQRVSFNADQLEAVLRVKG